MAKTPWAKMRAAAPRRPGFGAALGKNGRGAYQAAVAAGAPPAGTVAAAPATPSATPEDPRLTAYMNTATAGAGAVRDSSYGNTHYDVVTGANDLGFAWGKDNYAYDPKNAATAAVDPSNPFSKMALLQRSYEQQKSGTTNNYAASGQLNSGAFQRMKKENQFQNDAATQSLRNAFRDLLEQGRRGRDSATNTYATSINDASLNVLAQQLGG